MFSLFWFFLERLVTSKRLEIIIWFFLDWFSLFRLDLFFTIMDDLLFNCITELFNNWVIINFNSIRFIYLFRFQLRVIFSVLFVFYIGWLVIIIPNEVDLRWLLDDNLNLDWRLLTNSIKRYWLLNKLSIHLNIIFLYILPWFQIKVLFICETFIAPIRESSSKLGKHIIVWIKLIFF